MLVEHQGDPPRAIRRAAWLVLLGLIALAVVVGGAALTTGGDPGGPGTTIPHPDDVDDAGFGSQQSEAIVPTPPGAGQASVAEGIVVHVSGAVADAGLVRLSPDARVADAIAAAGGVTADADLVAVNLAGRVTDGTQVVVPAVRDSGRAESGTAPNTAANAETISLNHSDAQAFQRIPGVGPVLAARIVEYRDEHGPFAVMEDLLDVPGIGEGRLADLRARLHLP